MIPVPSLEIRHEMAPLDEGLAGDVVGFLEHKGTPWIDDIHQRVQGNLMGAEDHYLVAFDRDLLAGHVWYCVAQSDPRLGIVGHVFIHPERRRRGIARALLASALSEFRARGGVIMQLFTSTPPSIPLYEQLGFENLFGQSSYHDQDWYMRYPVGSDECVAQWLTATPVTCRELQPEDLPRYCLLYNVERDLTLKDRAQQIGFGLEAELAFINAWQAIRQGRAACSVLDNGPTIVGAASLVAMEFPHQSHVGLFDFYVSSKASSYIPELVDHCLKTRHELGISKVFAMTVDPAKRSAMERIGFTWRAHLPGHYRVGREEHDGDLLELM